MKPDYQACQRKIFIKKRKGDASSHRLRRPFLAGLGEHLLGLPAYPFIVPSSSNWRHYSLCTSDSWGSFSHLAQNDVKVNLGSEPKAISVEAVMFTAPSGGGPII